MKKLLLLILAIFAIDVNAQTSVYHPFPDSNATWCYGHAGGDNVANYKGVAVYNLKGKATIEGVEYNVLTYFDTTAYYDLGSEIYLASTTSHASYYIRQDSAIKKVWIYDSTAIMERTFYDFNLNVGDTLDSSKIYWGVMPGIASADTFVITSIDSVLISGQYRKRYNWGTYCSRSSDSSMIEGIGSLFELMSPTGCFESASLLREFLKDNQVLYLDESYPDMTLNCSDVILSSRESIVPNKFSVFPNPFHTSTTIQLTREYENAELIIYDHLGKRCRQQKITSQTTIINRDDLAIGIYFIRITDGKGQTARGKIMIE